MNAWLLPDGIDELLPPEAEQAEYLRRELLDLFQSWGYQLIMPPFIEYLDSLLTGAGQDLDLQTFKITDQISGRLMGLRADITPQAARIDAHQLKQNKLNRLCYIGSVFRTQSDGFASSRNPMQIGAELFGHAGIESDIEIICLMIAALKKAGIDKIHLDLGHVGIFRGLAKQADLSPERQQALFTALQKKSAPEVAQLSADLDQGHFFQALVQLNGDAQIIEQAEQALAGADEAVQQALATLKQAGQRLQACLPDLPIHYDLAELRAYQYQTGLVFAAFVPHWGKEIARGGRYDGIGSKFGRHRPATGFSADLRTLMRFGQLDWQPPKTIYAPAEQDEALIQKMAELRDQGYRVVQCLPEEQPQGARLIKKNQSWQIEAASD